MIRNLSVVEGMTSQRCPGHRLGLKFCRLHGDAAPARRPATLAVLAGHSTIRTAVMGEDASQRKGRDPESREGDGGRHGPGRSTGASYSLNHSAACRAVDIAPMSELDQLVGAMGPRGKGVVEIASGA